MFWIICAATILIVGLAIVAPILRTRGQTEPAAAFDLRVYRDQLREVERDLERRVIGPEDADRLRAEIGRKVLDADRRLSQSRAMIRGGGRALAIGVLTALLIGAVALYLRQGAPGRDDLPIGQRIAQAQTAYESRPSQAEAEAEAAAMPRPPAQPVPEDFQALIEQLREAVARNPDDPRGLALLATNEMRLGNAAAARTAQQRLVDVQGDAASADDLVRLSALMTEAAGGLITPEAEAVLARALAADPAHPQGRYLLGLLQLQNGRPDRAFPIWRSLLEQGPADAPWMAPIGAAIRDLAWLAGQPDYVPPGPMPGPDADALAAAEGMTPEERQDMITGMVSQLEARLSQQGGTPEEWARLISSLVVIGNADHARMIWTEAQSRFASSPEALDTVRQAAISAGLAE
ncbi:c-type cytochrome biogenesis protein CcmI [Paracoccus subflavus]|uniref:C-type cytochrome biogenesis protein CcmI n=1 Tax=Paracoccus subflavus TaxID=2528244 RepID=A0A4V2JC46_9RHOB|nr:c-type cytochrome biogenesis protein CcmI [Paracoccus subflavus]TBN39433.1 c-type cytochrome biogenesis protein CcmI [Paracoccus subflavus]